MKRVIRASIDWDADSTEYVDIDIPLDEIDVSDINPAEVPWQEAIDDSFNCYDTFEESWNMFESECLETDMLFSGDRGYQPYSHLIILYYAWNEPDIFIEYTKPLAEKYWEANA